MITNLDPTYLSFEGALLAIPKLIKSRKVLIAIDGRGGSGKSTFAKLLHKKISGSTLVPLDGILGDGELYTKENIEKQFNIDFSANRFTLEMKEAIMKNKGDILIIEGCFSYLVNIDFDLKIWVEADRNVCYDRLIKRESDERTDILIEYILLANYKYQLCEDNYIKKYEPSKKADIIVRN